MSVNDTSSLKQEATLSYFFFVQEVLCRCKAICALTITPFSLGWQTKTWKILSLFGCFGFTLRENAGLVVATVVGYAYVYTPPKTGPHWQLVKALGAFGLMAPLGNISPPLWPVVASHLCDIQQIPNDFKRIMKYNIQLCTGWDILSKRQSRRGSCLLDITIIELIIRMPAWIQVSYLETKQKHWCVLYT